MQLGLCSLRKRVGILIQASALGKPARHWGNFHPSCFSPALLIETQGTVASSRHTDPPNARKRPCAVRK